VFLPQLKRIRWAVRAALILGVAASVAANILHARQNPISQAISAWPPLALLLTVELTSRIPMHKPLMAAVRVLATVAIAGIAAWVSYWHMQGVAFHYGETSTSSYLLPISVDGLIVVASVSLVELAGRIRMMEERKLAAAEPAVAPVVQAVRPIPAPVAQYAPVAAAPVYQPAPEPARELEPVLSGAVQAEPWPADPRPATAQHHTPVSEAGLATASPRVPTSPLSGRPLGGSPSNAPVSPALAGMVRGQAFPNGATSVRPNVTRAAVSAPPRNMVTSPTTSDATDPGSPRPRRPLLETADLADAIEAMRPEITPNELAQELGISPTRLRAVRREAREVRRSSVRR
jgi:Protein of unknown function (DUF2637)